MKGLILAGGNGTRLRPLTNVINKNLLPVGNKLMLEYPLAKMAEAGITEVMIVTGSQHLGMIVELCKSGREFGLDITYRVQERPEGIAHGIYQARTFAGNDDLLVILGDNLFDFDLSEVLKDFEPNKACVFVKEVHDPCRFGVVEYDFNLNIKNIIEKPQLAPSNDIVIGVYAYPSDCFEKIGRLKPSARGEYEVTDLNNMYIRESRLNYHRVDGFWIDCGTHESLKIANDWAWSKK